METLEQLETSVELIMKESEAEYKKHGLSDRYNQLSETEIALWRAIMKKRREQSNETSGQIT